LHKPKRKRRLEDGLLSRAMKQAFYDKQSCYGSVRLVREIRKQGLRCGKTRMRRLMVEAQLFPVQKRRVRPRTTKSNPYLPVAPNLLQGAAPATWPGQRWYSDITYIPTQEGWLYLAATIDGCSRKCSGWSTSDNLATDLVMQAARRAFASSAFLTPKDRDWANDDTQPVVIHHSDRGSQYASEAFRSFLMGKEITQSMSRKGNCFDNALTESFWATLKTECFNNFRSGVPLTRHEAKARIFAYIEVFYNRKRQHSALGYLSPVQFEQQLKTQKEKNLTLLLST
jgi:transposase InsO family protein